MPGSVPGIKSAYSRKAQVGYTRLGLTSLATAAPAVRSSSQHDAGIAQVLVAVNQVDLAHLDLPASRALDEAVSAPAREVARAVDAELADQVVRAHHAGGTVVLRLEHLDVADHADGARLRRLRPGITGAQTIDAVLHAAAVVEGDRDLAPRIAGVRRSRHPVDAFGRVHCEPVVEAQLVEQPRLLLDQHAEAVTLIGVGDCELVLLPIGEIRDQALIELLVDVIRADRGIVGELHVGHGS